MKAIDVTLLTSKSFKSPSNHREYNKHGFHICHAADVPVAHITTKVTFVKQKAHFGDERLMSLSLYRRSLTTPLCRGSFLAASSPCVSCSSLDRRLHTVARGVSQVVVAGAMGPWIAGESHRRTLEFPPVVCHVPPQTAGRSPLGPGCGCSSRLSLGGASPCRVRVAATTHAPRGYARGT